MEGACRQRATPIGAPWGGRRRRPTSPEEVVAYWLASPEHHARLLDPAYTEIGAGYYYLSNTIYGHWWVVDLAAH